MKFNAIPGTAPLKQVNYECITISVIHPRLNRRGNARIKTILRRVHETTVAVERQYVSHICVCMCAQARVRVRARV